MYTTPAIVFGFHGCDREVAMRVICHGEPQGDFGQHLIHDPRQQGIHLVGMEGRQINHMRPIATHHYGCLDAGHRHGEPQMADKITSFQLRCISSRNTRRSV